MTELRLALSLSAIQAMAQGEELVFDVTEEQLRITLRCDDDAVLSVRDQIEKAMLHFLPTDPNLH